MKKKLFMAALLLMLCIGCLFTVSVAAESTTPALSIDYTNLSYSDSVYIKYAVSAKNVVEDDVRLLVWREADTNGYAYGTQDETVLPAYTDTIEGEEYIIFDYKNIAAKEMGDDIYVRACVTVGEDRYESETVKYSVLRYAYDTIHDDNADDVLQELMQDMLAYGATAQKLFNYKATTPVYNKTTDTIDWYDITVVNGTLADGFTSGLIYQGTEVTITAAPAPDGQVFSHWENSMSEQVGTEVTCTVTATANEIYTAIYIPTVTYSEGLAYTENTDADGNVVSYTVSGIGTCQDTDIVIPATYNGLPVTSIDALAFYNCTSLKSITIPDSVTSIDQQVFSGCTNLENITVLSGNTIYHSIGNCIIKKATKELIIGCKNSIIPLDGSVTSIGGWAFCGCASLTSITIPDSVTSIGESAFAGCTSLTSITIPDSVTSIGGWAFYDCTNLTSITIGNVVTSIGDYTFYGCTSLESITIPDSVTSLGDLSFCACTSLTSITIPDSVTSIGNWAFHGCTNLSSVTIGNNVTSIGGSAFYNCTSLTSITIPDSVTSIAFHAFEGCSKLTNVTFNPPARWWYTSSFYATSGTEFAEADLKDTIKAATYLRSTYCNYCWKRTVSTGLTYEVNTDGTTCTITGIGTCEDTKLIIPVKIDGYVVTAIGDNAFKECTMLTSVYVSTGTTTIGSYAFYNCTDLTSVTLPNSVTSIGDSAFSSCTSLASITIPDSVASINGFAFSGCTSLASITIPDSVTSIGHCAFRDCTNLMSVTFETPAGWWYASHATPTKRTALAEDDLKNAATAATYLRSTYKNCDLTRTPPKLAYTVNADGTTCTINGPGTCIVGSEINIPTEIDGYVVTTIGRGAFNDCTNLPSIIIPDSVTTIGDYAFYYCKNLSIITIGNNVTSIGQYAFAGCTSLTSIFIPDSVTSIGNWAFYNCTCLSSVTIGNNVTSIGIGVFQSCGLSSVTFKNPAGWWYASSSSAASGTAIAETDLNVPTKAANYLRSTYRNYYWKRN